MNDRNISPLHSMMSQGINVVLAKALLNIECKQNQMIAAMDCAWEEKFRTMKNDYDEKINTQDIEIQFMRKEIEQLYKSICIPEGVGPVVSHQLDTVALHTDITSIRSTMERTFDDVRYNVEALTDRVKETNEKVSEQKEGLSAVQDFMEDFIKMYECRNGVIDFVITRHENDIKTSLDTHRRINDEVTILSQQMVNMRGNFISNVDSLKAKLDEYIVAAKWNETHVSLDEHNQLRIDLEDQIIECDMKYDHVLLMVQQQWDDYKRRSDELDVVKGVISRAKQRREFALTNAQTQYRVLTESMKNESKTGEIYDDLVDVDNYPIVPKNQMKNDENRKVHFHDETEASAYTPFQPNVECNVRFEIEDNESEFGNSVNLVLLDEYSIH